MNVIQYKFPLEDKEKFISQIKGSEILFGDLSKSQYTYFAVPNTTSDDDYITLRTKVTPDGKSVDVKVKKSNSHEYTHLESDISDISSMEKILTYAGSKPIVTFHKSRATYKNDFIRLDLDDLEELGAFLEVKFSPDNKEKAHSFLESIDIDVSTADHRSNVQIFLEKNDGQSATKG